MSAKAHTDYLYDGAEILANPQAVFTRLRAEGDVLWSGSMRRWLVLSRAACETALRDPRLDVYNVFQAFDHVARLSGHRLDELINVSRWIPFLNNAERHKQLRGLFARVLQAIMDPYLATYAAASQELLDAFRTARGGDFATGYADRVHVEAFGRVCGLDPADRADFASLASSDGAVDFAVRVGALLEANDRARVLLDRMTAILARSQGSDMLDRIGGHLSRAGIEDSQQARAEFLVALTLLGRDTLAGTLTLGLAHMLDAQEGYLAPPDWRAPQDIVNEVIRLSSAVQIVNRVATRPIDLCGQKIAEGDVLMIYLPAANADPAAFANAERMDPSHPESIAFGAGPHLCVGRQMTRRAIEISLRHLSQLNIAARPDRSIGPGKNTRKYETMHIKVL
ncbi:cytochrome P450 [Nioella nitratireducens]|uniref:cytochrome P450 n=1 Tax=Nioella nitratireducens TaxID=1287720 RepID=UPI0008FD46E1|nr:cytochrome P450 [Nioella nitratireducens]